MLGHNGNASLRGCTGLHVRSGHLQVIRRVTVTALLGAVSSLALGTAPAFAQSQSSLDQTQAEGGGARMLEEIVITAQKREQTLQDVGMSVTAFSGDALDEFDVDVSYDIASLTPGVHISGAFAGQNTQFSIRGATQNDFNDVVESPTAVYLDEGYIALANAQTFSTFDLERVEVLKGPQSTLFGRNATGGVVHYISRKPVFGEWNGYLEAEGGVFADSDSPADAEAFEVTGGLNVPLGETLAMRVSFKYSYRDAILKNLFPQGLVGGSPGPGAGQDMGDDDTLAGRAIIAWEPREDLRLRVMGNANRTDTGVAPFQSEPVIAVFEEVDGSAEIVDVIDVGPNETRASIGPDGSDFGTDVDNDGVFAAQGDPDDFFGRFGVGTDFFGFRDPDGKDFTTSSDFAFDDINDLTVWGVNANIEWDINDAVTLTSVSDFKGYDKMMFLDVDSAPVNQSANFATTDSTSFTQELRASGQLDTIDWVAGFFYLNINNDTTNGLKFPVGSVVPGSPFDLTSLANLTTNSYSGFVQADWAPIEKLNFTGGVRVIQEEKDYFFRQALFFTQDSRQVNQGDPLLIGPLFENGAPTAFRGDLSDTHWAGVLRVEYNVNRDLMFWASAKRGVKAGGFNAQLAGGIPVPDIEDRIQYKEEVLYSYEGGFKSTLFDGLARFNANYFYYDYEDYQAFLFTGVAGLVFNADAKFQGVEAEIEASPIEGLDLRLNGSWLDAEVKDVPLRLGGPVVRDVRPTFAPEFQAAGSARYEWPLLGGWMSVLVDFNYADEVFFNLRNFSGDKFDEYVLFNSRLGWRSGDGHWEFAFKVRNITDTRAGVTGFDLATFCGCNEVSFRDPRFFGFSVRYSL